MSQTTHTEARKPVVKHTDTGVKMRGRTGAQNAAAIRLAEHEDIKSVTNFSTGMIIVHPYSMDAIRETYHTAQEFDAVIDFWYMSTIVDEVHPVFELGGF